VPLNLRNNGNNVSFNWIFYLSDYIRGLYCWLYCWCESDARQVTDWHCATLNAAGREVVPDGQSRQLVRELNGW